MCGVIGIIGPQNGRFEALAQNGVGYEIYRGLLALQHRGQDAAGIATYDQKTRTFNVEKDLGLVSQALPQSRIEKLYGEMAIGHTRYATTGTDSKQDVQPLVTGMPFGLAMAHNGNLLNYVSLAQSLSNDFKRQLLTKNDLEVMMHYWAHFLLQGAAVPGPESFTFDNIKKAAARFFETMVGGYAVVGLMAGQGLIAFRDPKGIRPLVLGRVEREEGVYHCLASETAALLQLGYRYVRDIQAGEIVFIDQDGAFHSEVVSSVSARAPCMFEWVYFSGAESASENQSVYSVRLKLGERLGFKAKAAIEAGKINPDVVMPVPDTSRTAALSVASTLGMIYREGLIKNRYVARSFILNTQEKREAAVEQKLIPIQSEIAGKSIFLIDDSIVRGTTSKKIVDLLKKHGAKDVTFGITCPPLRYACYYGIDFPNPSALIANGRTVEEIEAYIGAKVIYLDEEDLRQAIGLSELCMACINNKYPTPTFEAEVFSSHRQKVRVEGRK